jgi:hypothetical protein
MPSLKRPLFNGIIQPMHVVIGAPVVTPIFTPPDAANVKNPQTFELHLWLLPDASDAVNQTTYQIHASVGPWATATKKGVVWSGQEVPGGFVYGPRPIKILDGFPVRGNVQLSFLASKLAGADIYPLGPQLWGYYLPVGQGSKYEQEHRFIGNQPNLQGFNSGVPLQFTADFAAGPNPSPSEIIHTFDPNRIDEISLAFAPVANPDETGFAVLVFEDANNQPLIPGHYVKFQLYGNVANPTFSGSDLTKPGVAPGPLLQSPYMILGTPFGGNPALHHIRAFAIAGEAAVIAIGVHGFYIRH